MGYEEKGQAKLLIQIITIVLPLFVILTAAISGWLKRTQ